MNFFPILLLFFGFALVYSTIIYRKSMTSDHVVGMTIVGGLFVFASCVIFGAVIK